MPQLLEPSDARLFLERDTLEVEELSLAEGRAAVLSLRSPVKETANEDAAALIALDDASAVLAVADGVGGAPAGEQASRVALEVLWTTLQHAPLEPGSARPVILDAIEEAHRAVAELGLGAATTLVVAEIQSGRVRTYHVGDSMALVTGLRGRIKHQTVPHSPVGFAVEAGVLGELEAMGHEDRHLVSNVLGGSNMRIEVGQTLQLAPHDTVVLASDGLTDNLLTSEIVDGLRKGPLLTSLRTLAGYAHQRMVEPPDDDPSKPDDMTVVAFRLDRPKKGS